MSYQIIPINAKTCHHVRVNRTDPIYGYEYDVMSSIAGPTGYGPCRSCLRKIKQGESRLLFLHNPFGNLLGDFAGPVFIHAEECPEFSLSTELPSELSFLKILLRSYDFNGHFVAHLELGTWALTTGIEKLLENPKCTEVHIRNVVARCYIAKAVRT